MRTRIITGLVAFLAMLGLALAAAPSASAHYNGTDENCTAKVLTGSSATNYWCVTWAIGLDASGTPYSNPAQCKVGNHSSKRIYVTSTTRGYQSAGGSNTVHQTDTTNYTVEPGATKVWNCYGINGAISGDPHTTSDGRNFVNVSMAIEGYSYEAATVYDTH